MIRDIRFALLLQFFQLADGHLAVARGFQFLLLQTANFLRLPVAGLVGQILEPGFFLLGSGAGGHDLSLELGEAQFHCLLYFQPFRLQASEFLPSDIVDLFRQGFAAGILIRTPAVLLRQGAGLKTGLVLG